MRRSSRSLRAVSRRLFRRQSTSSRNVEKTSFDHENIIPEHSYQPATGLHRAPSDLQHETKESPPHPDVLSKETSPQMPSVFDQGNTDEVETDPTIEEVEDGDEPYDLKAPAPAMRHENIEFLATRLFSADHLDLIIQDTRTCATFKSFLKEHRPDDLRMLRRYIEIRKAIAAIEYANAIARDIALDQDTDTPLAATLTDGFAEQSRQARTYLVEESLTAYITHRFVVLVTDILNKEVTGNIAPVMKELIPSLAEVFCISDPSLPDNPIVYASEEFYATTQYGKDYTIGRNCRFLQGPKTADSAVHRLIKAVQAGREVVETVLNYRRDGSPFMNLLMIAPLYDNHGNVRYFLGSQIDVTCLVESGRGLDSFAQLLERDRTGLHLRNNLPSVDLAGELGSMLNFAEFSRLNERARWTAEVVAMANVPQRQQSNASRRSAQRLTFGVEDIKLHRDVWTTPDHTRIPRMPVVFQNYMLVRPFPSLRITFTSPALRIPGVIQSKLMDRIGGTASVRKSILTTLEQGRSFTARVTWHTTANAARSDHASRDTPPQEMTNNPGLGIGSPAQTNGRVRWIHCTPLLGSDDRVGVWMIVMIDNEEAYGRSQRSWHNVEINLPLHEKLEEEENSIDERQSDDDDILRQEGRESQVSSPSAQERREVDDHFRDF